jgi:hypothetical protein
MAFCSSCGQDLAGSAFCVNCGAKAGEKVDNKKQVVPKAKVENNQHEDQSEILKSSMDKKKTAILIGGISVGLVAVLIIITFSTARHWTKTVVPERAETFSTETYSTGYYDVVDDNVSPCWVGQAWYLCINQHVAIYNATCASYPLTITASSYCESYSGMIDDMEARNSYGTYVSSLCSWGYLSVVAEQGTRQVSNNDYRPAKTKEVVCYLGFLGECE